MVVNGLLDGFSKSDTEILSMPLIKYIYRITWAPDGYFYIGQTARLKDRVYDHILCIADCDNEKNKKIQPVHRFISSIMRPHYEQADYGRKKKPSFEIYVRQQTAAYIWGITGDQAAADLFEAHYIKLHKGDPLCLNTKFQ